MKPTFVFSVLASVLLVACSQSANPTRPSPVTAQPQGLFAQFAPTMVADWSTLTSQRTFVPAAATAEAPSAPANLAFQVSGSTVILTWSPSAAGTVETYVLEAGSAAGQSNIVSFATGGTATSLTVTNVPNGTYFVRVRARNADGASGPSNEVSITVGSGGGPCSTPGAPAGFSASANGNAVTLGWGAVAGATSYVIEAGSASGASNIIVFETGSAATSLTSNAPNGTYYLRVRARTACGLSAASNEAVVTVGGTPPPPGGVGGRWLGLVANGEGATSTPNDCGVERADLQLDLVQNGTALTGTITFTMQVSRCDPPNTRRSTSATGTVNGTNITFTGFPDPTHRIDVIGTISGTRMTGRLLSNGGVDGDSTFVINKQ